MNKIQSQKQNPNGYNYTALIQGGIGPDVWDREVQVSAVDLLDAAKQMAGRAQEMHGWLVSVEQNDRPEWQQEQVVKLEDALKRIVNYPVHSEPYGGAYAMQDIAAKALGCAK